MDTSSTRWRVIREAVGVILMVVSAGLAVMFLIAVAGIGATVVTAALLALAGLGRRLASGTPAETDDEPQRDFEPEGEGPLYVDPEDPQAFIPKR